MSGLEPDVSKVVWQEVRNGEVFKFMNPNDNVVGFLVGKRKGDFEAQVYDLEFKDKQFVVFGGAVLDRKLDKVQIGDLIKITYLGEKTGEKTKRKYKDFKVEVRTKKVDGS